MNKPDAIIIHCSATKEGADFRAADIDRMHRQKGFKGIGYHYVINLNGKIEAGKCLTADGAHCTGYNNHSIGICYIGGLDRNGRAKDTRTPAQKRAMAELVNGLCREFPVEEVLGHRDTSPDLNGNGVVEAFEWIKMCPCFEVREEFTSFLKPVIVKP